MTLRKYSLHNSVSQITKTAATKCWLHYQPSKTPHSTLATQHYSTLRDCFDSTQTTIICQVKSMNHNSCVLASYISQLMRGVCMNKSDWSICQLTIYSYGHAVFSVRSLGDYCPLMGKWLLVIGDGYLQQLPN